MCNSWRRRIGRWTALSGSGVLFTVKLVGYFGEHRATRRGRLPMLREKGAKGAEVIGRSRREELK